MASARIDIISIGTLSRNRIWNETEATRTAHATTTLIRAGKRTILVDPGLPSPILSARLSERAGIKAEQVDTVFLTNFRQPHRAGLSLFAHAKLMIHENEIDAAKAYLERMLNEAPEEDEDRKHFERELELLGTLTAADDKLAPDVDLFPLFGYTAGTCGLLVSTPTTTTLIAADAVPTLDHFLAGQVLPDAADIKAAQEAMGEIYEIADIIVPGHDNLFVNPRIQGM